MYWPSKDIDTRLSEKISADWWAAAAVIQEKISEASGKRKKDGPLTSKPAELRNNLSKKVQGGMKAGAY